MAKDELYVGEEVIVRGIGDGRIYEKIYVLGMTEPMYLVGYWLDGKQQTVRLRGGEILVQKRGTLVDER